MIYHKDLEKRWSSFSFLEQMANIGSEVERTINWKNKNDEEYSRLAFERALELMDFTMSDPKNRKRLKEVARVREFFADYFQCGNNYSFDDKFFKDYFSYFAIALNR